ncbi:MULTISPECIES: hypothetical protein [Methylobacterium]|jgi:hypothetical protein|uniref:Uncharacterized protein n=3 Tax=Methylobacterium TaxID=407 RepID=A0AAE8L7Y1_9HYPH|nr:MULTISPECIES: hypothetical protein [Methylobacterium]KOX58195.1 hypothetical protein ADL19_08655 [Streptomyces purpurogeneiscleroticus]AIQ92210.1 protein of unassigned function [Methylobacterium oryzae CBMB20]APT32673.1 hypothetical protein MCBMB27_03382 [Methylobacterium phyllosphaerae]AWV16124.1 hypothetical protein A3862_11925 [Methylobacterium sp. XJLW]MBA9065976.1 hypothetical protein [Methylobacterium fujisawaense]
MLDNHHDAAAQAERRLERSVAAALRVIAAAHVERQAPPVSAARRRLSEVYGATRLARRLEQERRTA